jgi:hypothetical protein
MPSLKQYTLDREISLGVKLSPALALRAVQDSELASVFEYFEYGSPSVHALAQPGLRPHSTVLELAAPWSPPVGVLSALEEELTRTGQTYLGDHIGWLRTDVSAPGAGYLLPPPFESRTLENIERNVRAVTQYIDLPLALELPVVYESTGSLKWIEFLRKLEALLPSSAGWLLDIGHLVSTSHNLQIPFDEILDVLNLQGRNLYEIHLSSVSVEATGVVHDRHIGSREDLEAAIGLLFGLEVGAANWTIESSATDLKQIRQLAKWVQETPVDQDATLLAPRPSPTQKALRQSEAKGRLVILRDKVVNQVERAKFPTPVIERLKQWNLGDWVAFRSFLDDPRIGLRTLPAFESPEDDGQNLLPSIWKFLLRRNLVTHDHAIAATQAVVRRTALDLLDEIKRDQLSIEWVIEGVGDRQQLWVKTNSLGQLVAEPTSRSHEKLGSHPYIFLDLTQEVPEGELKWKQRRQPSYFQKHQNQTAFNSLKPISTRLLQGRLDRSKIGETHSRTERR